MEWKVLQTLNIAIMRMRDYSMQSITAVFYFANKTSTPNDLWYSWNFAWWNIVQGSSSPADALSQMHPDFQPEASFSPILPEVAVAQELACICQSTAAEHEPACRDTSQGTRGLPNSLFRGMGEEDASCWKSGGIQERASAGWTFLDNISPWTGLVGQSISVLGHPREQLRNGPGGCCRWRPGTHCPGGNGQIQSPIQ